MSIIDLLGGDTLGPAECRVLIDGAEIDDLYPALALVEVDADRGNWTTAKLEFDTRRIEDGNWTVADDERIKPWRRIDIRAVFGDQEQYLMGGYVRQVKLECPEDQGAAKLSVECQDASLLMDRTHINQVWAEDDATTDDARIADIIARRSDQDIRYEGPVFPIQNLNQNATDLRFLKQRADANGNEMIFLEDSLYIGPMRLDLEPQPAMLVYAGTDTNCISFSVDDDGHQPDQVQYQLAAETGTEPEVETVEPDSPLLGTRPATSDAPGDFTWQVPRAGRVSDQQARVSAQAAANRAAMRIKGSGELDGSRYANVLRIGEPVLVDGAGERYGGRWYVDACTHRFDSNGYRVSFKLLRNGYGDDQSATANPWPR
ncbi:phage late control D family protein [Marinobacterium aestuariivivens]|uniref:Phage late control D family protein n=1 Tax=Marinobacterium aestuariivivens TaxID=1698799 RepID=A0ABW2A1M0_9GAMM